MARPSYTDAPQLAHVVEGTAMLQNEAGNIVVAKPSYAILAPNQTRPTHSDLLTYKDKDYSIVGVEDKKSFSRILWYKVIFQ
jgi:hypothetical protein